MDVNASGISTTSQENDLYNFGQNNLKEKRNVLSRHSMFMHLPFAFCKNSVHVLSYVLTNKVSLNFLI